MACPIASLLDRPKFSDHAKFCTDFSVSTKNNLLFRSKTSHFLAIFQAPFNLTARLAAELQGLSDRGPFCNGERIHKDPIFCRIFCNLQNGLPGLAQCENPQFNWHRQSLFTECLRRLRGRRDVGIAIGLAAGSNAV
jgi:hypothetical protein